MAVREAAGAATWGGSALRRNALMPFGARGFIPGARSMRVPGALGLAAQRSGNIGGERRVAPFAIAWRSRAGRGFRALARSRQSGALASGEGPPTLAVSSARQVSRPRARWRGGLGSARGGLREPPEAASESRPAAPGGDGRAPCKGAIERRLSPRGWLPRPRRPTAVAAARASPPEGCLATVLPCRRLAAVSGCGRASRLAVRATPWPRSNPATVDDDCYRLEGGPGGRPPSGRRRRWQAFRALRCRRPRGARMLDPLR